MAFRWRVDDGLKIECWLGSFVIFQGIRTSIAKIPYIFVIFQGGGGSESSVPPLDPHMNIIDTLYFYVLTVSASTIWTPS